MIRRSIGLRLNLIIILVVTTITFGFGYSDYMKKSRSRKLALQNSLEVVSGRLAATLKYPFWEYNYSIMNSFIEAEMNDRNIYKILLYDLTSNTVVVGKMRDENGYIVNDKTPVNKDRLLIKARKDIVVRNSPIAQVEVYVSFSKMYREIRNEMIALLVRFFVMVVLLVVTLLFFIDLSILRPVKELMKVFDIVASGNFNEEVDTNRKDELGKLAISFSKMRDAIRSKIEDMNIEINKRKMVEKEMRRLRNFQEEIINSMSSIIIGIDQNGLVTHWNYEAEKISGLSGRHARGMFFSDALSFFKDYQEEIIRHLKEKTPLNMHKLTLVKETGEETTSSVDVSVYPLYFEEKNGAVIRIDDITERVLMEELLVQNEKMLSVGGLAAGMAHEINNPLAGILQNIQVIKARIGSGLPKNKKVAEECGTSIDVIEAYMTKRGFHEMIDAVIESGRRAAKIVENMLSFSRKSESKKLPVNLSELIDATIDLAANDYDLKKRYDFKQIKINRFYDESLTPVLCEFSKIQQVILNILKNGAYAMSENELESQFIIRVYHEEGFARIEIEDNGNGMPEEISRRIFEPFFTTKDVKEGTGLGLSVSYFIITENHGGTLTVDSAPGRGTVFTLSLPHGVKE